MEQSARRPISAILAIGLLVWLSIWPVFGSALSFAGEVPTRWPALVHFANSPLQWRVGFFISGCFRFFAAWLVFTARLRFALGAAILFAALYVPAFQIVWAQRTIAMVAAIAAVLLVGYLVVEGRRHGA
ncbi:membrane hypothetical protein [Luteimonas sp. 9C]|uniref:hypothetical protein n=1 Tax=Luteimonas sp. 9C TaxID=2653148 RepID=UPI0012EF1065|nr:hypothetical protein [Luteimonas sp. 9C]VXB72182.1 membrane hypothetical protein [Luteimonas sp. 9C]